MSTATLEATSNLLGAERIIVDAVVNSVEKALVMCGRSAKCVGVSRVPMRDTGSLTGICGVLGQVSGFLTINMSEKTAIKNAEGLLQQSFDSVTTEVIDGTGEFTNLVVGGVKAALSNSDWAFGQITVPSVIIGDGYSISYAKGLEFTCVTFEYNSPDELVVADRLMHVCLSLLPC